MKDNPKQTETKFKLINPVNVFGFPETEVPRTIYIEKRILPKLKKVVKNFDATEHRSGSRKKRQFFTRHI